MKKPFRPKRTKGFELPPAVPPRFAVVTSALKWSK